VVGQIKQRQALNVVSTIIVTVIPSIYLIHIYLLFVVFALPYDIIVYKLLSLPIPRPMTHGRPLTIVITNM
jgi:hypothetical protein